MTLCAPTVTGPVAVLTRSLRIKGADPAATVTVRSIAPGNERVIASGLIGATEGHLPLPAGVFLTPTDLLVAEQATAQDKSGPSGMPPTPVGASPTSPPELGQVTVSSHLYGCGRLTFVTGAELGAEVSLRWSGIVQGKAIADVQGARISTSGLPPSGSIEAFQSLPAGGPWTPGDGPSSTWPVDATPGSVGKQLTPPSIAQPVPECDTVIFFDGAFDGADVTLYRSDGATQAGLAPSSQSHMVLATPVRNGETFAIGQSLPACRRLEGRSGNTAPASASLIGPPRLPASLCSGTHWLALSGLIPSARVTIRLSPKSGGTTVLTGFAPQSTSVLDPATGVVALDYTFDLGDGNPLAEGTVSVVQEACGQASPAATASITAAGAPVATPVIDPPPHECEKRVTATGLTPNGLVAVYVLRSSGESSVFGPVGVISPTMPFEVAPELTAKSHVWVREWVCDSGFIDSDHALEVLPNPSSGSPTIALAHEGDTEVRVEHVIPNGTVSVYLAPPNTEESALPVASTFVGDAEPVGGSVKVSLLKRLKLLELELKIGSRVWARQTRCHDQVTGPSIAVVQRAPLAPQAVVPANHSYIPVDDDVRLVWTDPGAGTTRAASSYRLSVSGPGVSLGPMQAFPGFLVPQPPNGFGYGHTYTWKVQGLNAGGNGEQATARFSTSSQPPAAWTITATTAGCTASATGLTPNKYYEVYVQMDGDLVLAGYPQQGTTTDVRSSVPVRTLKATAAGALPAFTVAFPGGLEPFSFFDSSHQNSGPIVVPNQPVEPGEGIKVVYRLSGDVVWSISKLAQVT